MIYGQYDPKFCNDEASVWKYMNNGKPLLLAFLCVLLRQNGLVTCKSMDDQSLSMKTYIDR